MYNNLENFILLSFEYSKGGLQMEKKTFQEFKGVSYEQWKQLAEKTLKGKAFDSLIRQTYDNVILKPLYTKDDATACKEVAALLLTNSGGIAQELFATNPHQANAIVVDALQNGQQVLHLLADKETLQGNDSVSVERPGIPLSFTKDFESVFNGVATGKYPVLLYTGYIASPLLSMFVSYAKKKEIPLDVLKGTVGADPLGYLAEEGELVTSLSACYDDMVKTIRWSQDHTPQLHTIFVRTDAYHNAGANAVQELAIAFATAVEYIRAGIERGLQAKDVISKITFSFSVGSYLFTEIAKLRAFRVVWSKIAEQFGVSNVKNAVHVSTSKRTKTVFDPYTNLLRATTEAFSAIVGGADTLHVSPFDDAAGFENENGKRLARNIQHILREEAHLEKVLDPARGSFYVEELTHEIAKQAWDLFRSIEQQGGMSTVLQDGSLHEEIAQVAKQRRANVCSLKQTIVGTNRYVNLSEEKLTGESKEVYNRAAEVTSFKEQRKGMNTPSYQEVTIEELIVAFSEGSSLGEVTANQVKNGLQIAAFLPMRDAEPFEELRKTAEQFLSQTGRSPRALVVALAADENMKTIASTLKSCGFEVASVDSLPGDMEEVEAVFLYDNKESLLTSIAQLSSVGKKLYVMGMYEREEGETVLASGADGLLPDMGSLLPLLHELYNELEVTV